MRVNVYAEEMSDDIEIIAKEIDGHKFTGLRLYLYLPATDPKTGEQHQGKFMHRPGDDDSSAVTFWGKRDLRAVLRKMLAKLDAHYADSDLAAVSPAEYEAVRNWEDNNPVDLSIFQQLMGRGLVEPHTVRNPAGEWRTMFHLTATGLAMFKAINAGEAA